MIVLSLYWQTVTAMVKIGELCVIVLKVNLGYTTKFVVVPLKKIH